MFNRTETIAAISTAMNNSGIGIIRISGDDSFDIIRKIFRPGNSAKDIADVKSHTVHYGHIMDGDNPVDEVLILILKGPHTYTREDTVEIDCHGGIFVMNRILELVLKSGARCAEPGEFTRRAFINGRIDLSQAEAVIDVINAENDYALKSAVTQLRGSVSEKIREQRAVLLEQIAYIEAALDDPEHIDMDDYGSVLLPVIRKCSCCINDLLKTADDGRIIKEGIKTVILGRPNVGKSSFMNVLVGTDRAIVTDIAGTTRDTLEETVRIGDVTLNIIDTAGIRDTDNIIEKIGVDKAREYAGDADLIVWMIDSSAPFSLEDEEIAGIIAGKKVIILLNKQDLDQIIDEEYLKNRFVQLGHPEYCDIPVMRISAKNESGIDSFRETVSHMFYNKEINFNDQVYITNMRHKEAIAGAAESLKRASDSIEAGMPEDFYTIDLMDAYTYLGVVIGESIEDDLADEIFAKFCMGK
ncbi:MAG: tRNA uridine-5-carboxymethylaminomethyl(34) synthesis GTPase MnmE [Parasporobacterium sp.]|nr:tRNA uridine-5-carboxymethylaminomethyl(34) synthesis GTPase MnmE [Parasporobacterium sp.]